MVRPEKEAIRSSAESMVTAKHHYYRQVSIEGSEEEVVPFVVGRCRPSGSQHANSKGSDQGV